MFAARSKRWQYCLAMTIAVASVSAPAYAESAKPIRILVGFAAGGAPDTIARAFADQLRAATGTTVLVENRPGASGKIAIDALLSSSPDGNTLALLPVSSTVLLPLITKTANYDVGKDLTALGILAEFGFAAATGPATKTVSLEQFKSWANKEQSVISYATPGDASPQHFLGTQLSRLLSLKMTHVPYKGGQAAIPDLLGGQISMVITTEQLLVPYAAKGSLHPLFVTSTHRNSKMPDIPTAREAGLSQLEKEDWFGLFGRAGMPKELVQKFRKDVSSIVSSQAYQKVVVTSLGYQAPAKQPGNLDGTMEIERKDWMNRINVAGYKP